MAHPVPELSHAARTRCMAILAGLLAHVVRRVPQPHFLDVASSIDCCSCHCYTGFFRSQKGWPRRAHSGGHAVASCTSRNHGESFRTRCMANPPRPPAPTVTPVKSTNPVVCLYARPTAPHILPSRRPESFPLRDTRPNASHASHGHQRYKNRFRATW